MGTRHITAVYVDGAYKVAQYGQLDGYPDGAGLSVLQFARTIADKEARKAFADKVRACRFITDEEADELERKYRSGEIKALDAEYPAFSRNTGDEILGLISEHGVRVLHNQIEFVANGLFCEWVWVIDLDSGRFEGWKGWQGSPPECEDRWTFLLDKCEDGYYTPALAGDFPLDDLPTDKEFLDAFKVEEAQ